MEFHSPVRVLEFHSKGVAMEKQSLVLGKQPVHRGKVSP